MASTREASSCVGAESIGVTDTRPDGALIDGRARHAVTFVAGVASTREVSRCVGANGIGVTVNRADDALIDVRARLSVPSWPVWQAREKPPTVLVRWRREHHTQGRRRIHKQPKKGVEIDSAVQVQRGQDEVRQGAARGKDGDTNVRRLVAAIS